MRFTKITTRALPALTLALALAAPAAAAQQRRTRKRPATPPKSPATAKAAPASPANPYGLVTTTSGLTYMITYHGGGKQPKTGDNVLVHYTGMLTNGVQFDSSRNRGEPIEFTLGAGQVIKGWDEGIAKLGIGDRAILIIPPDLAYGSRAMGGVIPANSTLVFIVQLVGIKGEGVPQPDGD